MENHEPMAERKVLGKGLSALIPDVPGDDMPDKAIYCTLDAIQINPHQPRTEFNQEKIKELSDSIKEKGVIQPLLVKEVENGYQLIAGERRLRAATLAGLKKVPVIVKKVSEEEQLEYSLIENMQRENLNPIEEAEAYQKLINDFNYTQQKLSQVMGKDRATIANQIRLLKLPPMIKQSIARQELTTGHARCLLSILEAQKQREAFRLVLSKGLSVRETEKLVKKLNRVAKKHSPQEDLVHLEYIENELIQWLGTKVRIAGKGKRGKIVIEFYSPEELERIIEKIKGINGQSRI
jgi:ParB family chromosome partitioning protein